MPHFEDLVKILADVVPNEHWDKVKDLIPLARNENVAGKYATSFNKDGLLIDRHTNDNFVAKHMGNNYLYVYYNKVEKKFESIQVYTKNHLLTREDVLQLLIEYKKEEPKPVEINTGGDRIDAFNIDQILNVDNVFQPTADRVEITLAPRATRTILPRIRATGGGYIPRPTRRNG